MRTLLSALLFVTGSALGHVPYFERSDLTADAPFVIDDVEQSKAIYAWLETANDVDVFRLRVDEAALLYIKTIIPVCSELVDFRPSFSIEGPGLREVTLHDDSAAGLDRPSLYEFFSDQFYFEGPIFRLRVEEPGDYRVSFFDSRGHVGDYVAIIGRQERFSVEDRSRSMRNTKIIRAMEYLHGPCSDMG